MSGNDSRTDPLRPKRRWGRWLGLAALLLVGLIIVLHAGLSRVAERKLNHQVAVYRAAGEPMSGAELARLDADTVADADNAALTLRAAAASVDENSPAVRAFDEILHEYREDPVRPPLTEDEVKRMRDLLAANPAALAGASKAVTQPGVDWKLNFSTPMVLSLLPDLNPQRRLAQVLGAAALVAHHDGNDAEALRRVREMLFISRAVDRQPTLVSHLVAIGISALATHHLTLIAPELTVSTDGSAEGGAGGGRAATPEQVRELIAELLDDRPIHEGRKRALRGERVMQLDAATALAYGKIPLDQLSGSPSDGRTPEQRRRAAKVSGYAIKPIALNDALIMIRYATGLVESGEADDLHALRAKLPRFPMEVKENHVMHLVASMLLPSLDRAIEQDFRNLATRQTAATALAVRWYALEHDGQLPGRLEDLVPKYLPKVPVDPMAAGGKPLGYVAGERPIVYSVGENGRDDGGKEPPPTATAREIRAMSDEVVHLKRHPRPPKPEEPKEAEKSQGPADLATPAPESAAEPVLVPPAPQP